MQRHRPVAPVLEAVTLCTTRGQRQHRVLAIQSLNRGLLVHTEHRRVDGWIHVQADDLSRLLLEVRVVGRHVPMEPMRPQTVLAPQPRDRHLGNAELRCQAAPAPVGAVTALRALPLRSSRFRARPTCGTFSLGSPPPTAREGPGRPLAPRPRGLPAPPGSPTDQLQASDQQRAPSIHTPVAFHALSFALLSHKCATLASNEHATARCLTSDPRGHTTLAPLALRAHSQPTLLDEPAEHRSGGRGKTYEGTAPRNPEPLPPSKPTLSTRATRSCILLL